jgi:hypothetical protein
MIQEVTGGAGAAGAEAQGKKRYGIQEVERDDERGGRSKRARVEDESD